MSSPVGRPRMKDAEELILQCQTAGDKGARLLAEVLATNPSLKELSLRASRIGDNSAIALAAFWGTPASRSVFVIVLLSARKIFFWGCSSGTRHNTAGSDPRRDRHGVLVVMALLRV
jgi:hypothetical protein